MHLVAETDERDRLSARALQWQHRHLALATAKPRRRDDPFERGATDATRDRAHAGTIVLIGNDRNDHDVGGHRRRIATAHSYLHRVAL